MTEVNLQKFKEYGIEKYDLSQFDKRQSAIDILLEKIKYWPVTARMDLANHMLASLEIPPPVNLMMNEKEIKELYDSGMEDRRAYGQSSDFGKNYHTRTHIWKYLITNSIWKKSLVLQ